MRVVAPARDPESDADLADPQESADRVTAQTPRPFIVCFVGRSGSTAIKFDLDQHPRIEMRAEAMGGARLPPWPGSRELSDDNRLAWLDYHWRPRGLAAGFKLQFDRAAPQFDDWPRLVSAVRSHRAAVFKLVRRDRLRHTVAVLRSEALRLFNDGSGSVRAESSEAARAFAERPIQVDIAAFEHTVRSLELQHADLERFVGAFDEVHEIAYEDYLADRLSVLNAVAAVVGVEPFAEAPPETLRKVSPDDLRRAVANYEEVMQAAAELGLRA